jgi:quinohemoprotein ethanol dehydrogenase
VINPEAQYNAKQGVVVYPSAGGAHSSSPMAFNPGTGLVYIPISPNSSFTFRALDDFRLTPGVMNTGLALGGAASGGPPPVVPRTFGPIRELPPGQRGVLSAWDPVIQRERWFQPGGGPGGGGTLTTAGNLVFQTINDGRLLAYSAEHGEKLREIQTGAGGGMGPPITYLLDGKQFVALFGGTGPGRAGPGGPPPNPRLFVYTLL